MDPRLDRLADETIDHALARGARQAAVQIGRGRFVELKQREGKIETLQASTSRGLSLALYVDGRYSSNSTSNLDPDAVQGFVEATLEMTRRIAADPHRHLPDPSLYGPAPGVELDLYDPGVDALQMPRREQLVARVEQAARAAGGAVLSVTSSLTTSGSESLQVHSNGFRGQRAATSFVLGASVTARDEGDRRPEDGWWTVARHLEDLPAADEIGREAARRALDRLGAGKVASAAMPLVVENRAAGRLIGALLAPLGGAALQQGRSCFEGRRGERIGSELLSLRDDPFVPRGLGSRTYDGEGLAARELPVITAGVLDNYFIDVYYGRKLDLPPTTGGGSNLVLATGERSLEQLVSDVQRGILVTSFLGGNSNPATGDFSFGVSGFAIEAGAPGRPVSEMNITGSHADLWHRLVAVGDDPYPYSAIGAPSLVFDEVQFSGM